MSPRAVFDCMVFLQAITNERGPAAACFDLVDENKLTLVVSPETLAEVRDVLERPKIRAKFPHMSDDRIQRLFHIVKQMGIWLDAVPQLFSYSRDPNDEPYINLAIASSARYLVTRDKDLLDLMADEAFRQHAPDLTILNPVALLQELALERQRVQTPGQAPEQERGREVR